MENKSEIHLQLARRAFSRIQEAIQKEQGILIEVAAEELVAGSEIAGKLEGAEYTSRVLLTIVTGMTVAMGPESGIEIPDLLTLTAKAMTRPKEEWPKEPYLEKRIEEIRKKRAEATPAPEAPKPRAPRKPPVHPEWKPSPAVQARNRRAYKPHHVPSRAKSYERQKALLEFIEAQPERQATWKELMRAGFNEDHRMHNLLNALVQGHGDWRKPRLKRIGIGSYKAIEA